MLCFAFDRWADYHQRFVLHELEVIEAQRGTRPGAVKLHTQSTSWWFACGHLTRADGVFDFAVPNAADAKLGTPRGRSLRSKAAREVLTQLQLPPDAARALLLDAWRLAVSQVLASVRQATGRRFNLVAVPLSASRNYSGHITFEQTDRLAAALRERAQSLSTPVEQLAALLWEDADGARLRS